MSETFQDISKNTTVEASHGGNSEDLLKEVQKENLSLYETIQHFLSVQEELLKLRGLHEPEEAYNCLFQLLQNYIRIDLFEIYLHGDDPEDDDLIVYKKSSKSLEILAPNYLFPFTTGEKHQVITKFNPVIKELTGKEERSTFHDLPTAILSPLIFQGKCIGLTKIGLTLPSRELAGIRMEVINYLLKDLAAYVGTRSLSSRLRWVASLNRGVIESVRQGVIAIDHNGKILCSNPAAQIIFTDSTDSTHYKISIVPGMASVIEEVISPRGPRESLVDYPMELTTQNGSVVPLLVSATPLEVEHDGNVGWVFLIQDTSLNLEVNNLRRLDSLKSEFFLGLIHDMKTPLTGIISGWDLLQDSPDNFTPDQIEVLKIIQASTERLQNLAADILDMSALEAATDETMETANLSELAEKIVEPVMLKSTKHHFTLKTGEDPILINCQPRRIARVIENLLGNAVKYSPHGGNIHIQVHKNGNMAELSVKDEGVGICKDELPHIWERFHRGNNQKSVMIEGSGLGLSVIKMVVDKHKGRVQVESKAGKGSKFTVQLPLHQTNPK